MRVIHTLLLVCEQILNRTFKCTWTLCHLANLDRYYYLLKNVHTSVVKVNERIHSTFV